MAGHLYSYFDSAKAREASSHATEEEEARLFRSQLQHRGQWLPSLVLRRTLLDHQVVAQKFHLVPSFESTRTFNPDVTFTPAVPHSWFIVRCSRMSWSLGFFFVVDAWCRDVENLVAIELPGYVWWNFTFLKLDRHVFVHWNPSDTKYCRACSKLYEKSATSMNRILLHERFSFRLLAFHWKLFAKSSITRVDI